MKNKYIPSLLSLPPFLPPSIFQSSQPPHTTRLGYPTSRGIFLKQKSTAVTLVTKTLQRLPISARIKSKLLVTVILSPLLFLHSHPPSAPQTHQAHSSLRPCASYSFLQLLPSLSLPESCLSSAQIAVPLPSPSPPGGGWGAGCLL